MQYSLNKGHHHLQMTAAKVMAIISRLPGCAGQAADAVSAKTQVQRKVSGLKRITSSPEGYHDGDTGEIIYEKVYCEESYSIIPD